MNMNNRFEVKFDVIQVDKYEPGISGDFELLGIGNESINADLHVIAQKSVRGSFETIIGNQSEQGLQGSFETVGVGKNDIAGSFSIHPKNKMKVKFDVSAPPRITKTLEAIKDVFIYEGNKSYNYGLWSYLQVGVSPEGLVSRSFIDFDFSDFPTNVYITKATLVLVSKTRNAFEGLELSTANKEYDETNVVWGNQPLRQDFISVNNIEDAAYICNFDVTDTVKNVWYGQNHNNHGFLLKSYDETSPQGVIQFFSKESSNYIPKLEIEYFDLDVYVPGVGAIQSDLEVIVPDYEEGLHGDFEVYKENDIATLKSDFSVFNGQMVNGDLYVPYNEDVSGDFFIWRSDYISADFNVAGKPEYYPDVNGDFYAVLYDPIIGMHYARVKGSFEVADSIWLYGDFYIANNVPLKSSFEIPDAREINGFFDVVHYDEIHGSIDDILPLDTSELECDFDVVHYKDISGNIDDVKPLDRVEINGDFNLIGIGKEDLNCDFEVVHYKQIKCDFYIPKKDDVSGSFEIPKNKDINGDFDVKHAKEISGDILVTPDAKVRGKLEVVIPTEEKGLKGSFQAIAQISVKGDFNIGQDRMFGDFTVVAQESIHGDLFVPDKKDLKGSFVVWKSAYIQGSLDVTPLSFADLFCGFYLDGRIPVVKSYGFIM